jgi:NADPH:quinone reductase-like Zn-dependent oxidoreductase
MTAPGGPEVLRLVELPEPEITGERDVKVRLRAAGINPADVPAGTRRRRASRAGSGAGHWESGADDRRLTWACCGLFLFLS